MKKIYLLLLLPLLFIPLACGQSQQPSSPSGAAAPYALASGNNGGGNLKGEESHDPCEPVTFNFFDDFEAEFVAGNNIPLLADPALSSPFGLINEKRPTASGKLVLRDRDITAPGGVGGGFTPLNLPVALDFTDGNGVFVTFHFQVPKHYRIASGSVGFEVTNFGGDGGHLFKYLSPDGITFTPVGDDANVNDVTYNFPVSSGGRDVYLKVQTGTTAGIFEGVWISNIQGSLIAEHKGCHGDLDTD